MASQAQELAPVVSGLDSVVSPMGSDEFLKNYFGKSFLYVPGFKGKYSNLAPWNQLNHILEEHRLEPPRLKLYQAGEEIPKDKYLTMPYDMGPRLKAAQLTSPLPHGATLIIHPLDAFTNPL